MRVVSECVTAVLCLMWAGLVQAAFNYAPSPGTIDLGTWGVNAPLSGQIITCMRSYKGGINNRTYFYTRVKLGEASELVNTLDSSMKLPVTLQYMGSNPHNHPMENGDVPGSVVAVLSTTNSLKMPGTGCGSNGDGPQDNVVFDISVADSDVYRVSAGTYETSFSLILRQVKSGVKNPRKTDDLTVEAVVPTLIELSKFPTSLLGDPYDEVSSTMSENAPFCVYSNTGAYTLEASGTADSTAPTAFAMQGKITTSKYLPFTVHLDGDTDASDAAPVVNGPTAVGGYSTDQAAGSYSRDCNGGSNAAIYVEVKREDIFAVPAQTYEGSVTVTVKPE